MVERHGEIGDGWRTGSNLRRALGGEVKGMGVRANVTAERVI